ncbi:MAG: ABC transporter substrate-binding protein [Actinomycetota bacterium]|nr:ABC transporter substrate-binding protein [Actinomycetota bacterium]
MATLSRPLALLMCASLVMAACSGTTPSADPGGGEPTPSESPSRPGPTPDEPEPTATGDEAGDERSADAGAGGSTGPAVDGDRVLSVAIQEPGTLDPLRVADPGAALVVRQLFEGLTRWDQVKRKVVPAAARNWKVKDGGRVFRFTLRKGMKFHDGSPVTARDFRFAFDRIARKRNASDIAYTLELVRGFTATNGFGDTDRLRGLRSPGPRTLVVRLSEPYRDFPAVLTHPALVPVPAEAVAGKRSWVRRPVGNGPFKLATRWTPGRPIKLDAWRKGVGAPTLGGLRFVPYPDALASWPDILEGSLDVAEVPAAEIDAAKAAFGAGGFGPLLAGYFVGFNIDSEQLDDIRMRKAITRAIDRRRIARGIYDRSLVAPRGIVPRGIPGFHRDVCLKLCRHDPRAARRLVRKLPSGERTVTLDYTKDSPHGRVARSVAGDLRAAGLDVDVNGYRFPAFLRRLSEDQQSLYRLGWIAEYPAADGFLTPLFHSDSLDNHSGVDSERVDDLLARAHRARSSKERWRLYRRAEIEILEQVPVAPIGTFMTRWVVRPPGVNVHFDVMGGFDAVSVEG